MDSTEKKSQITLLKRQLALGYRFWKFKLLESIFGRAMTVKVRAETVTFAVDGVDEWWAVNAYPEREVVERVVDAIDSDDVVWDVGAHIGLFTCPVAKHLEDGSVVSFEPEPSNVETLRENVDANDLDNVSPQPVALGDVTGTASLGVSEDGSMHRLGETSASEPTVQRTVEVRTTTGDEFADQRDEVPNVVKIDVEGHELSVLDGMTEVLSLPDCYLAVCEIHKTYGVRADEVHSRMDAHGFSPVETFSDQGTEIVIYRATS